MASVGAVVMAHPVRAESAEKVSERVGAPIVFDDEGPPSTDTERRWRTGIRALREVVSQGKEWSLVIQDDAIVCRDIVPALEVALEPLGGEGLVSCYTGSGRPDQSSVRRALSDARIRGECWMYTRSLNWGVALVVPTNTIEDAIEWASGPEGVGRPYDQRLGLYYRDVLNWRYWCTVPSLVDHPPTGSLVGHEMVRVAHNFIGENKSALEVDWGRIPEGFVAELPDNQPRRRSILNQPTSERRYPINRPKYG